MRKITRKLTKEFSFESGHVLSGMPEGHKCGRPHGHSYRAIVTIVGALDDAGMILDAGVFGFIRDKLDHRVLNDVMEKNPTAENIAQFIMDETFAIILKAGAQEDVICERVILHETATCFAEVVCSEVL